MVKIISIQRIAERGFVQFIVDGKANAIEFNAALTDDEVRLLLPDGGPDIGQLRARAKELNIKGFIDKMKPETLKKLIAAAEAANVGQG